MRVSRFVPRPRSLAARLFAVQVVLVAAVVAGCAFFAWVTDHRQAEDAALRQATATARAVAHSPSVREAIRGDDPSAALQPYAEQVRTDTGVAFVTIMDPAGIRWTHPDPDRIGEPFLGHTETALRDGFLAETYTGTLGPSVRVVTAVTDGGQVVGLVSAGITLERIDAQVQRQLYALAGVAAAALALGGLGTYVITMRLRRQTHGMDSKQLARLYDYHQAALHAVREGLLLLDGGRIALINDAGRELLGLGEDAVGRPVDALGLPAALTDALLADAPRVDELHLAADRVVVLNASPLGHGDHPGTVVTLRDHTELQALSGELDSERGFSDALRSQAHEAANRLHTVVSLIELGRADEAVDFATAELSLAQALTDRVVTAVAEPVLAALLLGKAAQANERGVELVVSESSRLDDASLGPLPARDLVTVLGNLIDNAVDAVTGVRGGRVTVTLRAGPSDGLLLRVADNGPGVRAPDPEVPFTRGWSTKASGRGLGLALVRQAVGRAGGTVALAGVGTGGAEFVVRVPGAGAAGVGAAADPRT